MSRAAPSSGSRLYSKGHRRTSASSTSQNTRPWTALDQATWIDLKEALQAQTTVSGFAENTTGFLPASVLDEGRAEVAALGYLHANCGKSPCSA
jgi:hypothetical protein